MASPRTVRSRAYHGLTLALLGAAGSAAADEPAARAAAVDYAFRPATEARAVTLVDRREFRWREDISRSRQVFQILIGDDPITLEDGTRVRLDYDGEQSMDFGLTFSRRLGD